MTFLLPVHQEWQQGGIIAKKAITKSHEPGRAAARRRPRTGGAAFRTSAREKSTRHCEGPARSCAPAGDGAARHPYHLTVPGEVGLPQFGRESTP